MHHPHRYTTWFSSVVLTALIVLLAPVLQAQVLQQSENPMLQAPDDHNVVFYDNQDALLDSWLLTMKGRSLVDGGCEFSFPVLTLGPDENAVQARQVSTDYTDCTTVIEIGTPLGEAPVPEADSDGKSESVEVVPEGGVDLVPNGALRRQWAPATSSASAYYRVWWSDVINLKVHETKTNISWSYDGSCVTSASGSLNTYWLTASGWTKNYSGSWVTTGCSSRKVYAVTIFKNGAFCWPGDVFSYYNNVTVQGTYNNGLSGWVDSTYSTYPIGCPHLHYNTELHRITG